MLGLFAILLTVLAPLISQGVRASQPVDFTLAAFCSTQDIASGAPDDGKDSSPHTVPGQACGYCAFSLHFPALPPAASIAPPATQAPSFQPSALALAFRPALIASRAQPRAPPFQA